MYLPNRRRRAADASGAGRYGGALSWSWVMVLAAYQIAIQTVGQVAAIEPVGPLPQVARKLLGADP
jgi:hypothetical protein